MEYLSSHPLISIFIVAAIGYIVGKISYKGSSLGVAAVLFVGLIFGGLAPDIELPEILLQLGLVFYLYSIGLMSGDAFFNPFKKDRYYFWRVQLYSLYYLSHNICSVPI